jgi:hypothetical protein
MALERRFPGCATGCFPHPAICREILKGIAQALKVEALESENNRARRFHPKLNIAPQPIDIQKYKPDPFGCSTSRSGLLILHCQLLIPISNQQSAINLQRIHHRLNNLSFHPQFKI